MSASYKQGFLLWFWWVDVFMNYSSIFLSGKVLRKYRFRSILLFWLLGILYGLLFSWRIGNRFSAMMCRALQTPVSIVGLTATLLFPLITFLFVSNRSIFLAGIYVFLKGFGFGFLMHCICAFFQSVYWFVALFFLFSDISILFPYFVMLQKYCNDEFKQSYMCVLGYVFISLLIGFLDFFFLSPLFIRVLELC